MHLQSHSALLTLLCRHAVYSSPPPAWSLFLLMLRPFSYRFSVSVALFVTSTISPVMFVCLCHQVSNHRGSITRGPTLCTHFANLRLAPNHQRQLLTVISYLIPISIKTNYISIFWPLLHILMGFPTIWPALNLSVGTAFEVKTVSVVISKAPISDQLWLTRVDIGTVNFLPKTNFGLRSFPLKATFLSKLVPYLTRSP